MKAINKDDLIIVLNAIKDRSTLDLDDLETILDRFGDEYFVEGCEFVRTTENQEMTALRGVTSSRKNQLFNEKLKKGVGLYDQN